MYIFDTHAHYDDDWYDEDRDVLLKSMKEKNVKKICNIGATLKGCADTLKLIDEYDFFYGAIGVHPTEIEEIEAMGEEAGLALLREYLAHERVVAVGEIGLDYHLDSCDDEVKGLQKKWFRLQMELAQELKLPLVIHSRDAAADTYDEMKAADAGQIGGVVHCYSYSPEMAKQYVDMGFMIGVGGVVTFSNGRKLKETVEAIPLESIVLETDAPYLAPVPYRGKRNSSAYISYVAEAIADIKKIPVEGVYETTYENAHRLYRLTM